MPSRGQLNPRLGTLPSPLRVKLLPFLLFFFVSTSLADGSTTGEGYTVPVPGTSVSGYKNEIVLAAYYRMETRRNAASTLANGLTAGSEAVTTGSMGSGLRTAALGAGGE